MQHSNIFSYILLQKCHGSVVQDLCSHHSFKRFFLCLCAADSGQTLHHHYLATCLGLLCFLLDTQKQMITYSIVTMRADFDLAPEGTAII